MSKKIEDFIKASWKKSVQEPDWWVITGERNFFIAEALCKKYITANKDIEIKCSEFKGGEVTKDEQEWSHIHKTVLMFYGFAVECYLKAILIKKKMVKIFDDKDQFKLSRKLTKHINLVFYHNNESIFPKIDKCDKKFIGYLGRAVLSGKYPFEKSPSREFAYTAEFDNTVNFAKSLISDVVKQLDA